MEETKLSDYVADFFVRKGVQDVFVLTGGYIAHMIDSLHRRDDIRYICVQHEQAGAMAADAYSRVAGVPAVVYATSGPGATNTLTGVGCSYYDSIPVIIVCGNVNSEEFPPESRARQTGCQQCDIVSMARPIVKYAAQVLNPNDVRYELEKAYWHATSGRPGPVLLDFPINIQMAKVRVDQLRPFLPPPQVQSTLTLTDLVTQAAELFSRAKRPVLLVGGGIHLAQQQSEVQKLVETIRCPVVSSWAGTDLVKSSTGVYFGSVGVYGQRVANFVIQNSDAILALGSRLDSRQTGSNVSYFARQAMKIVVDIDSEELGQRVKADLPICADLREFMPLFTRECQKRAWPDYGEWVAKGQHWATTFKAVDQKFYVAKQIDPYRLMEWLAQHTNDTDIIIPDAGGDLVFAYQGYWPKADQRMFSALGMSPMGYSFPAAIGASLACRARRNVICIIGDGGMQLNIQELQTVAHYQIPIKILLLNNHSYGIIKLFVNSYLGSRRAAIDPSGGYTCPDFIKVAEAYGIKALRVSNESEMRSVLPQALADPGPVLCDIEIDDDQPMFPRLEWRRPIEDQWPYLDRQLFRTQMIVPPVPESQ